MDQAVPLHGGPNVTLIAPRLSRVGRGVLLSVNRAVDGMVFAVYLEQVLGTYTATGRCGGA